MATQPTEFSMCSGKLADLKLRALMWVEQAGKGVAEVEALIRIDPERTPAEIHLQLPEFLMRLSGGTLGSHL